MRRTRELAPIALALGCLGCAAAAPAGWLPAPRELGRWPYGASASVTTLEGWRRAVHGELIALGPDSVYVLDASGLRALPCRRVLRVTLQADRSRQLRAPSLAFPRGSQPEDRPIARSWEQVRPFARFPGGLPDSLDRGSLRLPPKR